MPTYYVAWWNVENLFDEENSPRRSEKVARVIKKDIAGWTPQLRDRKIARLASVIARMNDGAGPDLLGVCEVENRFVLDRLAEAVHELLPKRRYAVVHADTGDARGIDVAFLHDAGLLEALPDRVFFHVVMRRTATREIVQAGFRTRGGRTWTVFGNHWPSRSGGAHETAGYRHIAGETLAFFHQRVLETAGADAPVLAMGDFNDEPFDPSMVTHALGVRQRRRALEGGAPRLWNLMWPAMGTPDGSFYYQDQPNMLDQFLANANMARDDSPLRVDAESVRILKFPGTFDTGPYPRPVPFGGMGKKINTDGFSDHFPIGVRVTEDD